MRILFCCEFYAPSVGGVQEVIRQVAEHLVLLGHEVTVATTMLPNRTARMLEGVKIQEFRISGNYVSGIKGDVHAYHQLLMSGAFDLIVIKAAQQWTFDAVWPVLPKISAKKILIPCGFSGLFDPAYADYFARLPQILNQFDHLIFYTSHGRDIVFAKEHGLSRFSIVSNGAGERDFSVECDRSFRQRHGIRADALLLLTVGGLSRAKGHLEIAEAFLAADFAGQPAVLILNAKEEQHVELRSAWEQLAEKMSEYGRSLRDVHSAEGLLGVGKHVVHGALNKVGVSRGRYGAKHVHHTGFGQEIQMIVQRCHEQGLEKRIVVSDFARPELVQAYMNADLFVFASHVEYSPLVLFESAAAGTPFLSVPVGNAEEIAEWTGAGVICPASTDGKGDILPDIQLLAQHISRMAQDRDLLQRMGAQGRKQWRQNFTWEQICARYDEIFTAVCQKRQEPVHAQLSC